jgi:ATP-dependent DNA helicase RecG
MSAPVDARDRIARLAAHQLPAASARYVDSSRAVLLERLGIKTIGDLLGHAPFRYLDLTETAPLRDVKIGSEVTVVGRVHGITVKKPRPRLSITEVAIVDGTGVLLGVWFNQPWVQQRFAIGDSVAFAGRVELDYGLKQIKAPFVEKLADRADAPSPGRILPVHRATEGLTTGWLRRLVAAAVDDYADVPDHLPADLRSRQELVPLRTALRDIHFPATMAHARDARERLAFDELFALQIYMAMRRHAVTREHAGVSHRLDGPVLGALLNTPPMTPTADQARAIAEILRDLGEPRPMNRMLLGDVGTGKTLVALHAMAAAIDTGSQAAMMAPTEVLAIQYAEKLGPLLDELGVSWALLTGSTPGGSRKETLAGIAAGTLSVVFGTHALLEESVSFKRLTLAIVDEQHRFGVNQRLGLRGKGSAADLLVMTATPIPRSLALTLYGDLATSYLRERPNAASGVTTHVTSIAASGRAHEAIREAVRQGRQAYVVCALVDESDAAQAKAATREAERLGYEVFPDLRVGLLTGRMRPAEKAAVMSRFREGEIDVLVSTTVIEVGVDVANATVMIVENAERFGLAQLHQLRGRVGRGAHPGEVWLVSDARSAEARDRLAVLEATADGFALAEQDLRLRGEGHILGDRQHGLPDLRFSSLVDDLELVERCRREAFALVADDPHLLLPQHAPLLDHVRRVFAEAWEWVSAG